MKWVRVFAVLSWSLSALPALAFTQPPQPHKAELWIKPPSADARSETLDKQGPSALAVAAREFEQRVGGTWAFRIDPRTAKAESVQGSGIPLLPGKGNALRALEAVEPLARAFVSENDTWIGPPGGELRLNDKASQIREAGRLVSVQFDWLVDDVPVEGATVYVRINSGNVTQFGAVGIGEVRTSTVPALDAAAAVGKLLAYSGDEELALPEGEPELWLQPEGDAEHIDHRLIWRIVYRVPGRMETWEGRVDAHTGAIVGFRDLNQYARARGGVYPRTLFDGNETTVPLPFLDVTAAGSALTTDTSGFFAHAGGSVTSGLNGQYFDTNCSGCSSPAQPSVQSTTGTGWIDFGSGGQGQVGNGLSTAADRNAFYHLNQVRRAALKWLPSLPWLATTHFATYVNVDDTCNAGFGGDAMYFFRAGGGCNNTGEIADVMQHEWGHGIDTNTGGGDMGEGTANVTAMHMTHSPLIGPGFRTTGEPVRNVDQATNGIGAVTLSNYVSRCGSGVHCFGQVYGQAAWELAQSLTASQGQHTGWRTSERLFFTSLPDAGGTNTTTAHPIYDAYMQADDDDGNLTNGTPHAGAIHAAFNAHGIAGALLPTTTACTRPTQPALAVSPQCDRFVLSWSAVPGAVRYEVFRNELRQDSAQLPVAQLPAGQTSYTDTQVAPGVDYWYTVMAVNAADCESTVEQPVPARLFAQPILSVTAAAIDDTPRGNRSGFADPGEEVDLRLTVANFGEIGASGVSATIVSTTPGVTVLDGNASWPTIAAGGAAAHGDVLRFRTDPQVVACGAVLQFRLVPSEASGCAAETSYFTVQIGQSNGAAGFLCDSTPACFVAPGFAGLTAASPGSSCAEVALSWSAATSHCTNATITYSLYRDTSPGFVPSDANRVATGLTTTGFLDSLLEPGRTYSYVVRAFDSRSGEEANSVIRTVTSPVAPDIRAPVFAGLASAATGAGCGETTLGWSAAAETCSGPVGYQIYRSTNPGFTPSAQTLIGSTFATSFVDAALEPSGSYTYIVRALDGAGNEGANQVRLTAGASDTDLTLFQAHFDADAGGWQVVAPNTATSGNWAWGDPQGTSFQPENDATPAGTKCWITGLSSGSSDGAFDVDGGTTTLLSATYNLSQAVAPVVRYARWFTNDRGGSPGNDPFIVELSNNGGTSWAPLEQVSAGTPLAWVPVQLPVPGPLSASMRFRFTAADLGAGSLVEAGIDDFELAEPNAGCTVCPPNPAGVARIDARRAGADIVLDWSADPIQASRFVVYKVSGPTFDQALRIGSTSGRTFTHAAAALASENFYYQVTAVDACGNESALP